MIPVDASCRRPVPSYCLGAWRAAVFGFVGLALPLLGVSPGVAAQDCNLNGVDDATDIVTGWSRDCNGDGLPDECELIPLELAARDRAVPLESVPHRSVVADFNGDGRADVGIASQVSVTRSTVQLLLSGGDGTFLPQPIVEASSNLSGLVAADLDGDGDLDLATANFDTILILENTGGELTEAARLEAPRFTRVVQAMDADGDDLPDLVATVERDDAISVFKNLGDGRFGPPARAAVGDSPVDLVVADLDGDGVSDLVTANAKSDDVTVLLGVAGADLFAPATHYPAGMKDPDGVVVSDLDGDGDLDLITFNGRTVALLENTLAEPANTEPDVLEPNVARALTVTAVYPAPLAQVSALRSVIAGDLDADGDVDLAVGSASGSQLVVLSGDGTGRFAQPRAVTLEGHPSELLFADLDGQDPPEILALSRASNELVVVWQGEKEALALGATDIPAEVKPHSIASGDVDRDGNLDVLTANGGGNSVTVFLGAGDGDFQLPVHYGQPGYKITLALGDIDGDADLDVVSGIPIKFLLNQGDGTYVPSEHEPDARAEMVTTADLNGDGALDVVGTDGVSNFTVVLINKGDGTFAEPSNLRPDGTTGPWAVAAEDLDLDGDVDLAVAYRSSRNIAVLAGAGDGTFSTMGTYPVQGPAFYVVSADFDGNGFPDLASAQSLSHDVAILLNRGGADFVAAPNVPLGRAPYSLVTGELNQDGFCDVVVVNENDSSLSVLLGNGDGTFPPPFQYQVGVGQRFAVTGDLDHDGDNDVVVANREGRDITVLLNHSQEGAVVEDFLGAVCTILDFHRLSVPVLDGLAEREAHFLLPADENPELLPAAFANTRRFAFHGTFLTSVFPERFGDLGATELRDLWERRAERQYFAGSVQRLRLDRAVVGESAFSIAYGFSVLSDPTDSQEQLTLEEVRSLRVRLQSVFHLEPLGYVPQTAAERKAAASWNEPGFPVFLDDSSPPVEPPGPVATPTFELEIPPETVACATFNEAGESRAPRQEYELKSRLWFRAGAVALPTLNEAFEAELFDEVRFGPEQEVVEPLGPGEFRVLRVPGAGDVTTYRFTYTQPFSLSGGEIFELALAAPLTFTARGFEPVDGRRVLDEGFFVSEPGTEAFQGSLDGLPLVRYGSCTYETLPLWQVDAELEDGTRLRLLERFLPAESLARTGPAALVTANVLLGADQRKVTDYVDLVYSAFRHNCGVRYWVVLEPPLESAAALEGGIPAPIRAIELEAEDGPECEPGVVTASAHYLGADFEVLATRAVTAFTRGRAVGGTEPRFRRGDASGDASVNLLDAIGILEFLFRRGVAPPCRKAADIDDDGRITLLDAIGLARHLFVDFAALPAPSESCGQDPSPDGLTCAAPPACE